MRVGTILLCAACLEGQVFMARAAAQAETRLVLAAESAAPGSTVMAGIQLRLGEGWHTYWRNSGDSGLPVDVAWVLPSGVTAGEIQWPIPAKLTEGDLVTYVYDREVVLLAPLILTNTLTQGTLTLGARISWLECKASCVPGEAQVQAALQVSSSPRPSPEAGLIQTWQKRLPVRVPGIPARAWWDGPAAGALRRLMVEWTTAGAARPVDFFPYPSNAYEVQSATEHPSAVAGQTRLAKMIKKSAANWPSQIPGILVTTDSLGAAPAAFEVMLKPDHDSALNQVDAEEIGSTSMTESAGRSPVLWRKLGLAFLGGLILNVMPCVLPVLALKILGFVNHSQEAPGRIRSLGLCYAAGILSSFLVLAALVIGVKMAGHRAGWGMQFGNPEFLVLLTTLLTLVALNLFGVFEVNLTGKVLGTAAEYSSRQGATGAFLNGVLATVLATPCTAPYLGAALGFAFAQSAAVIVLVFLMIGTGLAAPYVVLTWNPRWIKFLPKPGVWMARFKMAMGFPMLATAVWLFSLTPLHYGRRILWLGLFLVIVALAAWIYGEFGQRGRAHRRLAVGAAVFLVVAGFAYALEGQLRWRSPNAPASSAALLQENPDGIAWEPWSAASVAQAREAGRPVLVDFTADWCLTCQLNKRTSLEIPSVRAKLKAMNAAALLGDYTTVPEAITAELNRFGRAGVPLVLVYPREVRLPPVLLPEVLTPQIVLNALDRAAR